MSSTAVERYVGFPGAFPVAGVRGRCRSERYGDGSDEKRGSWKVGCASEGDVDDVCAARDVRGWRRGWFAVVEAHVLHEPDACFHHP